MNIIWSKIWDEFDHTIGSKTWPSSDPEDSPFDTFVCKRCGEKIKCQMYGTQPITDPSFDEKAEDILQGHLMTHCSDSLLQNLNTTNRKALSILILRDLEKGKNNG